jgi:GTPase SAR1 family protein
LERMLGEPLCIAIGGSVSYGKSTLVNALLGRRVAQVQPEETRQVITHYRLLEFGPERAELEFKHDEREWVLLEDGLLPPIDQKKLEAVRVCNVFLDNEILQSMSLLDTPGLFSAQRGFSEQGLAALQGRKSQTQIAIASAQALIFLIENVILKHEHEILAGFARLFYAFAKSAHNTIVLLSKADVAGGDPTRPFDVASRRAHEIDRELRGVAAEVLPISSLLAETGTTGGLAEEDLQYLASFLKMPDRDLALTGSASMFLEHGEVGDTERRMRILNLLGPYGIRYCFEQMDEGISDPAEVAARLVQRSGLIELRAVVDETLLAYADVIKAEAALSALEQIAGRLARADITRNGFQLARWLQDQIEELRTAPEFQSLHEEQLARAIRKGIPPFDDVNIRNEVALLLMRAPPPARLGLPLNTDLIDLQRVIANRILRWRQRENNLFMRGDANTVDLVLGLYESLEGEVG